MEPGKPAVAGRTVLALAAAVMMAAASAASAPDAVRAGFSKAGYWDISGSPRRTTCLNLGWEFSLDGFKTSKSVVLPHSIDEGEIGFEASGGVNRQQPAWYRRRFAWKKRSPRQFIHFEAIMGKSRVTLNGRQVAEHFGGFLPIHVEVTGVLKDGENILEVWCDNSDDPSYPPGKPQRQLDFAYFGGIYRDAWLVETGDAYVTDSDNGGVYVSSRLEADGTWTVRSDVAIGGDIDGAEVVRFFDGREVGAEFKPENPSLWSPEEPNLHMLRVDVVKGGRRVDSVGVRFGIRDFRLDGDGLTLNGRPYPKKLIGVNRHQDCLFVGMAMPNSLHWRDVKKFHDAGMTVFRNAHYPQDPAFMDACDEFGMFVIVNTPGWQFWNAEDPAFERRVLDDVKKMVRRDRSRPSLFMWEPILNETSSPAEFAAKAFSIVKAETRPPNYCSCDRRMPGSRMFDMCFQLDRDRPNLAAFTREWGDFPDDWNAQNSSSRIAVEWGEGPMVEQARHYRDERRMGSLWNFRTAPKRLVGGTMWHGTDHARGYHPDNFFGGILTYGRQRKYSWHMMKAELTERPYAFLAHELAPGSPREMPVYSNCAYTATWLGRPFVPGVTEFIYEELQAMTYSNDKSLVEKAFFEFTMPDGERRRIYPAKRVRAVRLALDTEGLSPVADGSDLVAVTATLVDRRGTPKRYLRERIAFEVEGPAEIVGENPQETRWGEAIVYLRLLERSRPEKVSVRARLVRRGIHVASPGELTFTPGTDVVNATAGASGGAGDAALREVERDQRRFDFVPSAGK